MRSIFSTALSVSGLALMSAVPQGDVVSEQPEPGSLLDASANVELPTGDTADTSGAANIGTIEYHRTTESEEKLEAQARAIGADLYRTLRTVEGHKMAQLALLMADWVSFQHEESMRLHGKPYAFDADKLRAAFVGNKDNPGGLLFKDIPEMSAPEKANTGTTRSKLVEKSASLMQQIIPRAMRAAWLVYHGKAQFRLHGSTLQVVAPWNQIEPNFITKSPGKSGSTVTDPNNHSELVNIPNDYIDAQYAHWSGGFTARTLESGEMIQVPKVSLDETGRIKRGTKTPDDVAKKPLGEATVEQIAPTFAKGLGMALAAAKDTPAQLVKLQTDLGEAFDAMSKVMGSTASYFVSKAVETIDKINPADKDLPAEQWERKYGFNRKELWRLAEACENAVGETKREPIETMPVLALKEAIALKMVDRPFLGMTEEEQASIVQLTRALADYTGQNKGQGRKAG